MHLGAVGFIANPFSSATITNESKDMLVWKRRTAIIMMLEGKWTYTTDHNTAISSDEHAIIVQSGVFY